MWSKGSLLSWSKTEVWEDPDLDKSKRGTNRASRFSGRQYFVTICFRLTHQIDLVCLCFPLTSQVSEWMWWDPPGLLKGSWHLLCNRTGLEENQNQVRIFLHSLKPVKSNNRSNWSLFTLCDGFGWSVDQVKTPCVLNEFTVNVGVLTKCTDWKRPIPVHMISLALMAENGDLPGYNMFKSILWFSPLLLLMYPILFTSYFPNWYICGCISFISRNEQIPSEMWRDCEESLWWSRTLSAEDSKCELELVKLGLQQTGREFQHRGWSGNVLVKTGAGDARNWFACPSVTMEREK